jgi:predicted GIY-YIG superfamily endonuclease
MAIMLDIPTEQQINDFLPIEVYVAPPGCKDPPISDVTKEQLILEGWTLQKVGTPPETHIHVTAGLRARRKQYGLRPRLSATLHAAMGQTFSSFITKVSDTEAMYRLWERAQVVVLLSRTCFAKDIWFVGEPNQTAETLWKVLQHTTQYTTYTCCLLDSIIKGGDLTRNSVPVVDQMCHPFRPIDVPLPQNNSGCSYLLVSCRNPMVTYIGETGNLPERIDAHNSGYGSHQTQSHYLRPWAILAYVVGFGHSIKKRKAFEGQWKNRKRNEEEEKLRRLQPEEIIHLATCVISDRKCHDPHEDLRLVIAGRLEQEAR